MLTATFDIGTTAAKAVVVCDDGTVRFSASEGIVTLTDGEFREQAPDDWYRAFIAISEKIFERIPAEEIEAVVFSGQMQDMIPVDADGNAVRNAILYSDGRAGEEAERIMRTVGERKTAGNEGAGRGTAGGRTSENGPEAFAAAGEAEITRITGNHFDGSMPLPKILWYKEHEPENYARTAKILISSKDYILGKLTGRFVGDVTACSTAGAMELAVKRWSPELIAAAGLDADIFSEILYAHELVGTVSEKASEQTGYTTATRVYAGTGDAGATTLASGILSEGEYNINLGTSGWVAAVSEGCMESAGGGFNLAAMQPGKYINVVPFFNGGNVHKFVAGALSAKGGEADYSYISEILKGTEPGSGGVFFLPYLVGERFPIVDAKVRGTYFGIGQETTAGELARSALEGVAYSIRQGMELMGAPAKKVTVIGGGAREEAWCRILGGVTGQDIIVYKDPDLLPALAIAASVFMAEGLIKDYGEFIDGLTAQGHCTVCPQEPGAKAVYDGLYEKYKTIYPTVKGFYGSR